MRDEDLCRALVERFEHAARVHVRERFSGHSAARRRTREWSSPRPMRTGALQRLPAVHVPPLYPVIFRGPYLVSPERGLILRTASRLDAVSAYPGPT